MRFWIAMALGALVGNAVVVPLLMGSSLVDGLIIGAIAAALLIGVGYLKAGQRGRH